MVQPKNALVKISAVKINFVWCLPLSDANGASGVYTLQFTYYYRYSDLKYE
jgi:hypothetical protein